MMSSLPKWILHIQQKLETYNPQWKEYLLEKSSKSHLRLSYLLLVSDETNHLLNNMSFTLAKWVAHETSTGNKTGFVELLYQENKYVLYIDNNPTTKVVNIKYDHFLPLETEEEKLVTSLFIEFGIIEMIETCSQK